MSLPPPLPGLPPAPPVHPPRVRRRRRLGAALLMALVVLVAGAAGAYLGAVLADETETVNQPSRREIEVADPSDAAAPSMDVAAVLDVVEPSVVTISSDLTSGSGVGTGVILTGDGEILTNAHVVEDAVAVRVRFAGETEPRPATVLATDPGNDLALLRVDVDGLTPALFADPGSIAVGDEVIAIGYALGLDGPPSVTRGIISAVDRTLLGDDGALDGLLQTDAAISSGNSGGPLINSRGQVVGINTAVYQSDATTAANNVGFAISVDEALPIVEDLRARARGEQRVEGYLGVGVNDRTDGGQGAVVASVESGSPADKAGMEVGDLVLEAEGSRIDGRAGLIAVIRDAAPGDTVSLSVLRDGERLQLSATLVSKPG